MIGLASTARAYSIRLAERGDAPQIAELIRNCYGDTYLHKEFLDPHQIRALLEDGSFHFALAFSEEGAHVGQVALQRCSEGLYEHCRAIVSRDHRGRGLMDAMSRPLLKELAPRLGAQLVTGHSVTNHLRTQRYNRSAGFKPLGLLVSLFPRQQVRGVRTLTQAVSAVLVGLPVATRPRGRRLTLRGSELELASEVLDSLGIPTLGPSAPRRHQTLHLSPRTDESLHLLHLSWGRRGSEPTTFREGELLRRVHSERLVWADVPSEHAQAPAILEELRGLGFSLAAYLPCAGPSGEDLVRLQLHENPESLDWEQIQLLPEFSPLCEKIQRELELGLVPA